MRRTVTRTVTVVTITRSEIRWEAEPPAPPSHLQPPTALPAPQEPPTTEPASPPPTDPPASA